MPFAGRKKLDRDSDGTSECPLIGLHCELLLLNLTSEVTIYIHTHHPSLAFYLCNLAMNLTLSCFPCREKQSKAAVGGGGGQEPGNEAARAKGHIPL